jgi:DNA primase
MLNVESRNFPPDPSAKSESLPPVALIPHEIIEQISAASDIVEVISPHVVLKRAGGTFKGLCPFHNEKTPSFTVNPHRQRFKCFGCGAGGSAFDFVMLYEHVEFAEAARRLAGRAGIRIIEQELSAEDHARLSMRQRLLSLHAETADWFHQQLLKSRAAQVARDYLKGRGINIEIARSWKLGYAPDSWDAFGPWALSQGYSRHELAQSGLVKLRENDPDAEPDQSHFYDAFRGRVMFPICNDNGEVIAFSGRVLQADAKAAKYVNSPETALFTKGSILFGLHRSKRALIDKKSAIVCEGQLDLITAFEAGVQNVIAPQGTAFTERQAHILKRYVEEVVLCFDADTAGQKAAERSLGILLAENLAVRMIDLPAGEDPDSLIRGRGAPAFLERVQAAKDFFDFQLDRLTARPDFTSPKVKADAARRFGGWIALISDPILREAVMRNVSGRLDISITEFARLVRQPKPTAQSRELKGDAVAASPPPLDRTLRLLLHAILHSTEARAWILAAPWSDLLKLESDSAVVAKVLEGNPPLDNPSALNAFLATLEPGESATVCEILDEKPLDQALTTAQACWFEVGRREILRRRESASVKLRTPGLPVEDVLRLQTEVTALTKRLEEMPRVLLPPS